MTEQLWAGPFGDEYTERNADAGAKRRTFWRDLQHAHPAESVLELGCNLGGNLQWITAPVVAGVDLNAAALEAAQQRVPRALLRHASATHLPFGDGAFELVFTCGVLIHLDDEQLERAMGEMFRVSSRYVLALEYHSAAAVEVPYRGHRGALWKRPYDLLFARRFPALVLRAQGALGPDAGFDHVNFWLWGKA